MKWLKFFYPVKSIDSAKAKAMMKDGEGWTLLDVREPSEYADGHLEGSIHIPLFDTGKRAGELEPGKTLLVYCRSGSRSKLAIRILAVKGFTEVYNIKGGMLGWGE
jgi:rhodanese-related sulfurtransferase